jgi:hypothetical protein
MWNRARQTRPHALCDGHKSAPVALGLDRLGAIQRSEKGRSKMLILIVILVLLLGGGGGYYGHSRWGYGGGAGVGVGTVLLILLAVYMLGIIH